MHYDETDKQPAYFHDLTLFNIGPFGPKQTLHLHRKNGTPAQWTIILGENGTGKTTILRALASLEIVYRNRRHVLRHGQIREEWDYVRLAEKHRASDFVLPRYTMKADVALGHKLAEHRKGTRWRMVPVGVTREEEERVMELREGGGTSLDECGNLRVCAYGAARHIGTSRMASDLPEFRGWTLFRDDAPLLDPAEWLLQREFVGLNDPTQKRLARDLRAVLARLLPDVRDDGIRIQTSGQRPIVQFHTSDDWVPLRCLSLGYRALIAWTADFAASLFERYPESPNPLAEPAIALVDELDLHLHPKMQRDLLSFLSQTFPNTQFIVTAHSPLVIQAATDDANVVVLRREGDHAVIDNDPEHVRNWRIDQILTSDLFRLPSPYPKRIQRLLDERRRLLSKRELTSADVARAKELQSQVDELPIGETPEEIRAMAAIRRLAAAMEPEARHDQD